MRLDYPKEKYEIIVVDGASTDKTREIVKEYPIKLIIDKNGGLANSRNIGIKTAKGDHIASTDADCVVKEDWLNILVDSLYCDKTGSGKFKVGRKTSSKKFRQKMKDMNQWLKGVQNRVELKVWWQLLKQKLVGHYQYYGISGNIKGLQSYYCHTGRLAFKWINRRSQKKSYNWSQFNRFLSFNPLPKLKIYHLTYILFKRRGCAPEEPDEGKTQVRFCEGAHSYLGANAPTGGGL